MGRIKRKLNKKSGEEDIFFATFFICIDLNFNYQAGNSAILL